MQLSLIAEGAGNVSVFSVKNIHSLTESLEKNRNNSTIIIAHVEPGNEKVPVIPYEPLEIKRRFMASIRV